MTTHAHLSTSKLVCAVSQPDVVLSRHGNVSVDPWLVHQSMVVVMYLCRRFLCHHPYVNSTIVNLWTWSCIYVVSARSPVHTSIRSRRCLFVPTRQVVPSRPLDRLNDAPGAVEFSLASIVVITI